MIPCILLALGGNLVDGEYFHLRFSFPFLLCTSPLVLSVFFVVLFIFATSYKFLAKQLIRLYKFLSHSWAVHCSWIFPTCMHILKSVIELIESWESISGGSGHKYIVCNALFVFPSSMFCKNCSKQVISDWVLTWSHQNNPHSTGFCLWFQQGLAWILLKPAKSLPCKILEKEHNNCHNYLQQTNLRTPHEREVRS